MKQNHTAHSSLRRISNLIFSKARGFKLLLLLTALSATPAYSQNMWLGMEFTVGNSPMQVTELGRIYVQGNSRPHTLKLVEANSGNDVASGSVVINMAGGANEQFRYAALPNPVTLAANTKYYLVSEETNGGDYWHDSNTTIGTAAAATCNGPVSGIGRDFNTESGKPNYSYAPLDFKYTGGSTTALRDADNPVNAIPGLAYSYYEGMWDRVPNFGSINAVKTGYVPSFALTPRNRYDHFAFRYTGFVYVPADGMYTFSTTSDDGSVLMIGDRMVVNNDGAHGRIEVSGTIGLKAGNHAITVGYFDGTGQDVLDVTYAGPGLVKQIIPATALYWAASSTSTQPVVTLRNADNPSNVTNGVNYAYYEGNWNNVPTFSSLNAVKTGSVPSFVVSPRNRNDEFGFRYTGYIDVPTDGTYTFYTSSDDGSMLMIGETVVVDNNGIHGERENSGSIGLKAGKHAITVDYFDRGGQELLNVSYNGPGIGKQVIPTSALYRSATMGLAGLRDADNPTNVVSGLDYAYYEGAWSNVPDFNSLSAVKTGTISAFAVTPRNRNDDFAFKYTGYIDVPADGTYTFYTTSDDGSVLIIGDRVVVNNDGLHSEAEQSGSIGLKAGKHAISVGFFERTGQQVLNVSYTGPGLGKQVVPASALYRSTSGNRTATATATAAPTALPLSAYPNPSVDGRPTITWQAKQAQDVTLRIFNKQGTLVSLLSQSVPAGESTFKLPTTLTTGTYYLRATVDGEPQNFTLVVE
ncbi:PA14 domain-containing protein [Hymenobacter tibetensis]|uniref:PA14 domain-containing protein n=1 Tax=Hymenobacter tibetensis TaxID=497967 RepID=A0ABY4D364_9BACT|nr:PA14 domain-containing protein [Hymenobacter tibetensis]UOG76652.1 PA14 domain-containing protein [Hymenobacter tibetensis]